MITKSRFMIKFNSWKFLTKTISYINIPYLYIDDVVCANYQVTFASIAFHWIANKPFK